LSSLSSTAALALAVLLLSSCAAAGIVHGRVVDAQSQRPIPHARIRVPALNLEMEADSVGRFSFATPRASGCYVIRAIMIGYGGTYRSVRLPAAPGADLEIPLRANAIPEWRALFIQECVPSDSVRGLWGIDTLRVP
jgi:Carboxypeptidase regulatory-like domain